MPDEHTQQTHPNERQEPSDEHVRALGENRYVVSLDEEDERPLTGGTADQSRSVRDEPSRRLDDLDGAYALDLRARHGAEASHHRLETNDVCEAFESLLRWYAGCVAEDTPPETVVATLLANADLDLDGRGRVGSSATTR